jgi:DNA-binding NtrC family response regulator
MNSRQPSILVIDDESAILDTLRILLKNEGFDVSTAQGGKAGLEALKSSAPDIVLSDIRMPQVSGLDILAAVKEQDPETPVLLMTAQATLQSAIQAVNQGAFQYIMKPFSNDELLAHCRKAAELRQLRAENKQLKQEIRRRDKSTRIKPIGKAKAFLEVLRLAEQVAPTESAVLIQGETGTGKEVIARYIHELSTRADGLFLSLNCGALPESLLESELFGHVKGSFTGAVRDKQGLFAAARGGTFFLDEIGEMTPATQVKLLRVLQEREAIPVGGTEAIPVDVRVIAATNRDLEEDIKRGRFRSDLYYRLNVIAIHLPPLRDRRDDIPLFVDAFLARVAAEHGSTPRRLAGPAMELINAYDWPGNVRELENALERAAVLTKADLIDASALPPRVMERKAEPLTTARPMVNPTLDLIERAYIQYVLQAEGGNKTRAAEVLGIDPSTLYRKLSKYEGDAAPPPPPAHAG